MYTYICGKKDNTRLLLLYYSINFFNYGGKEQCGSAMQCAQYSFCLFTSGSFWQVLGGQHTPVTGLKHASPKI